MRFFKGHNKVFKGTQHIVDILHYFIISKSQCYYAQLPESLFFTFVFGHHFFKSMGIPIYFKGKHQFMTEKICNEIGDVRRTGVCPQYFGETWTHP